MASENTEQTNHKPTEAEFYALYKDKVTLREIIWPSLYALVDFIAYSEIQSDERLSLVKGLATVLNVTDMGYLRMKDDVDRYFHQYPLEQGSDEKL